MTYLFAQWNFALGLLKDRKNISGITLLHGIGGLRDKSPCRSIEELEFELIDRPDREISIHIPSDADLRPFRLQSTLNAFKAFLSAYYPDWSEVDWYCESWLLSPLLNELLEANSNILYFKQ